MPNFSANEAELDTRLDKWLYFIKHLDNFDSMPSIFKDDVFAQAFQKAEIANYGEAERENYEMNLKIYRDYKNTVDTAFDEGKLEGKLEVAKLAKQMGLPVTDICALTGLSRNQIEAL